MDASANNQNESNSCLCVVEDILKRGFSSKSFEEKRKIVNDGRPMPSLKTLVTQNKNCVRHFSVDLYVKHEWLTGCEFSKTLFCWPCLLFSMEKSIWRTGGFSDLSNLHKAIKRHEYSADHIKSILSITKFGKSRIEVSLSKAFADNVERHNQLVKDNLFILENLIDVVCYLLEQGLPLRGHDESATSSNRGKYVELVYLVSKYVPQLKNQIQNSKNFTGLSNLIQDDLMECIGNVLTSEIKMEVKCCKFVSIIADETSDISNKSQLSISFRYIDGLGILQERFLGFWNVSADRSAASLFKIIMKVIEDFDCKEKLVGQSYDGAAVMAGEISGLQTRIRAVCKDAIFVHCYAHKLNLVLSQSLAQIKDCKLFFMSLSGISSFFKKSTKRTFALDSLIQKRIPTAAPTRWQYNARIVAVIYEYKSELKHFFENLLENPADWDTESINCSRGFLSCFNDFNFNFLLTVFSEIFPFSDILFECLQKKNSDINLCNLKVREYLSIIESKRNDFEFLWEKTNSVVNISDYSSTKTTRIRMEKDIDLQTQYRKLLFEIIDNILMQLRERFQNIEKMKYLDLLNTSFFNKFKTNFPETEFKALQTTYGHHFDFPKLRTELTVVFNDKDFALKNILQIYLYLNEYGLVSTFKELSKLCELYLTIPTTSASSERSFSSLRRIKTYLRNSIGDEKLSVVSLISIEQKLLKTIKSRPNFYENVINEFKKQNRRIELNFK